MNDLELILAKYGSIIRCNATFPWTFKNHDPSLDIDVGVPQQRAYVHDITT